jgi:hypothetical protein
LGSDPDSGQSISRPRPDLHELGSDVDAPLDDEVDARPLEVREIAVLDNLRRAALDLANDPTPSLPGVPAPVSNRQVSEELVALTRKIGTSWDIGGSSRNFLRAAEDLSRRAGSVLRQPGRGRGREIADDQFEQRLEAAAAAVARRGKLTQESVAVEMELPLDTLKDYLQDRPGQWKALKARFTAPGGITE